ncbi:MAG: hypothetical protein ACOZCL_12165 [Bacillota bacterium]
MKDISIGQYVESTAGHDSGRNFVVICIINSQYVYISDGYNKTVENPKKKKVKHLKKLNYISDEIKCKIESGRKVTNSEIRSFIKSINRYREQEV